MFPSTGSTRTFIIFALCAFSSPHFMHSSNAENLVFPGMDNDVYKSWLDTASYTDISGLGSHQARFDNLRRHERSCFHSFDVECVHFLECHAFILVINHHSHLTTRTNLLLLPILPLLPPRPDPFVIDCSPLRLQVLKVICLHRFCVQS
jgi:hypothetical protein